MNILSKLGPTKSITARTTTVTTATAAAATSITTNKRPYKSLAETCLFLVTAVAEAVDKFQPHIFYKKLTKGSGVENVTNVRIWNAQNALPLHPKDY